MLGSGYIPSCYDATLLVTAIGLDSSPLAIRRVWHSRVNQYI